MAKCKACGHGYQIDPKQKLSTYIVKNPPTNENGETEKEKETKENGSAKENISDENLIDNNSSIVVKDEDDDDWVPEPIEETEKLSSEVCKCYV